MPYKIVINTLKAEGKVSKKYLFRIFEEWIKRVLISVGAWWMDPYFYLLILNTLMYPHALYPSKRFWHSKRVGFRIEEKWNNACLVVYHLTWFGCNWQMIFRKCVEHFYGSCLETLKNIFMEEKVRRAQGMDLHYIWNEAILKVPSDDTFHLIIKVL